MTADSETAQLIETSDAEQEVQTASQPTLRHGDTIGEEEANRLEGLATEVRDQDDLERDVFRQADHQLKHQANERDLKRLEKTRAEKS